jgi:hypothetical protein
LDQTIGAALSIERAVLKRSTSKKTAAAAAIAVSTAAGRLLPAAETARHVAGDLPP